MKPWDGRATPGPRVNSPCRPTAVATRTTSSPSGARCLSTSPSPFASTPDCAKHHQGPAWTSHLGKPTMPSSATKVEATRRPSRHSAVPALDDTPETLPESLRTPGLPPPKGPMSLPSPGNTGITPPDPRPEIAIGDTNTSCEADKRSSRTWTHPTSRNAATARQTAGNPRSTCPTNTGQNGPVLHVEPERFGQQLTDQRKCQSDEGRFFWNTPGQQTPTPA